VDEQAGLKKGCYRVYPAQSRGVRGDMHRNHFDCKNVILSEEKILDLLDGELSVAKEGD
jgi:hypothetical protein